MVDDRDKEKAEERRRFVIQAARRHLVDFSIATSPDYEPNWHHDLVARELENIAEHGDRDYKILVVTEPPRNGKSQQCSIDFPAWLLGSRPDREFILASYAADLAADFGSKTRNKVSSAAYKAIFPGVGLAEDEKARGRWSVRKESGGEMVDLGGGYVAVGVGGPITGRGADVLLVDDPFKNRKEANSQVIREAVWSWFISTAFTRLSPGGVVVVIMTRWHSDDLVGRILAKPELAARTKVLKFPAEANLDGRYRSAGEPLWPSRYSLEALREIKTTIGPYEWAALYQCAPVTSESQEFKPDWYKTISEEELSMMQTARYLAVDTAFSKKTQSDYCGFCDVEVDRENFWNVRAWRARLGPEEFCEALFTLQASRRYSRIGIERTSYTVGLKPYLDAEQRRRNVFLPIVELEHGGNQKEERIRAGLVPRYASGSVRHVEGRCDDLEEEQASFPNGVHDDVLDAEAYVPQLVAVEARKGVRVNKPKPRKNT